MKKTYSLEHPKIKVPRVVDSVKHDIKKIFAKERQKPLPADAIYWEFDCKCGQSAETAVSVHQSELTHRIDALVDNNFMSIYVEIVARAVGADEAKLNKGTRH